MIVFILFLFSANGCATPSTYECGLHGRFEYCIDGFPGCVVGCHCYPGYYFDTDSKICEPNTRLTQDFRRNIPSPSYPGLHMGMGMGGSPHMPSPMDPSTADAQENGEISDWLYNQFFKTIETGVINKTDEDDLKATRRSGAPLEPNISRRYRKRKSRYGRKRSSRKKYTRLRADDSDSSSDSDDSGSSSDNSGDLGSWERFEWSPRPGPPDQPGQPKEDAAQRQIVVYSKKPKPPLPSFIFLPNMQTPFFPPIGLPAPAMPLYPMVPIPPIQPLPGQPDCTEHGEATPTATTLETTRTTSGMSDATTKFTTTTPAPAPATHTPDETNPDKRKALHFGYNHPKGRKEFNKPPKDLFSQYQDGDSDTMFLGDTNSPFFEEDMKMEKEDEPDFKYISQLIHRDFNGTTTMRPTWKGLNFNKQPTPHTYVQSQAPNMPRRRQQIKPGRLNDMTRRQLDPKKNEQDNSYFSTLGRQIAKLIRGIETQNVGQDATKFEPAIRGTEIEDVGQDETKFDPAKDMKILQPFFGESTFAARSYWERFVRSPLMVRLNNFTEYGSVIAGNKQLFDLENKAQEATSPPPLSLLELENIINTMGTMHSQINDKKLGSNNDKPSNRSLNISLLPKINKIRVEEQQKPTMERNDYMLAPHTARKVADIFTNSNSKQKLINIIPDKQKLFIAKQRNNGNNKSERRNDATTSDGVYAYIRRRKPHSSTTVATMLVKGSLLKDVEQSGRELIKQNKVEQYYFNKRRHGDDRIIFVSGSDFVQSKRYFFEPNMNFQFENWSSN